MTRRAALSIAAGIVGALALVGLYLGLVTWAQGPEHALELLWGDRLFVGLISAGFGTQVGLFSYLRLLQRAMRRESVALAGAGTATSSVSMVACCAHHVADVLPIVGLSGLAVFLVEFRTPLMLLGIATNLVGIVVMLRQLRRVRSGYHVVSRRGAVAV
ncbi:MAG TPA: hypothetical protein VFC31_01065 [Candidatus Limnocylindria bacterium]|nr:hypothetical protein [Candidatus Limnocylindria bacterium]